MKHGLLIAAFYVSAAVADVTGVSCMPYLTTMAPGQTPRVDLRAYGDTALRDIPFTSLEKLESGLKAELKQTVAAFVANPAEVLDHVGTSGIYHDWVTGSHRLAGGLHTSEARRKLFEGQLRDQNFDPAKDSSRKAMEEIQRRVLAKSEPWAVALGMEMKNSGLDPTKLDDVHYHLVSHHKTRGAVVREANGVTKLRYGKSVFKSDKWKDSVRGAGVGRAPIGAKTLFPMDWNEAKIARAVEAILANAKTRILSLASKGDHIGQMMVEGQYEGVYITVALAGGKVNSAFPSWTQDRSRTVNEIQTEQRRNVSRLDSMVGDYARKYGLPELTLDEAVAIYLGKNPREKASPPLTESDYETYRRVLDPALRPNGNSDEPTTTEGGNDFRMGTTAQYYIESYLMNWRLLEDIPAAGN